MPEAGFPPTPRTLWHQSMEQETRDRCWRPESFRSSVLRTRRAVRRKTSGRQHPRSCSAPSDPVLDSRGSGSCPRSRLKEKCSRKVESLFLATEQAHGTQLFSVDAPDGKKKLLVLRRLIIRIGPWEKLKCIVLEMHRHFAEDPSAQVHSVVEILCRGKHHLGVLDIAGIEVERAFHDHA